MKENLTMEKTNNQKEICDKIMEILDKEQSALSIRDIKLRLERIGIKKSPQVITRYLKALEKEGKLVEMNENGKKV